MKLRSVLTGFLVVIMGMAAGLLLSMLFWPTPPQTPPAPQGLVSARVPSEPSPSPEETPQRAMQLSKMELTKAEPDLEASLTQASLPVSEEKMPEGEEVKQEGAIAESTQEPVRAKQSPPQKERVASDRAGRGSKTAKAAPGRDSFSFTLHVESFKSAEAAARRVNVFREEGLDAFTRPAEVPGKGLFHRVFVGKFQDRASASKFLEKLKAEKKVQAGRVLSRSETGG